MTFSNGSVNVTQSLAAARLVSARPPIIRVALLMIFMPGNLFKTGRILSAFTCASVRKIECAAFFNRLLQFVQDWASASAGKLGVGHGAAANRLINPIITSKMNIHLRFKSARYLILQYS
jgi:hypothetical protein